MQLKLSFLNRIPKFFLRDLMLLDAQKFSEPAKNCVILPATLQINLYDLNNLLDKGETAVGFADSVKVDVG